MKASKSNNKKSKKDVKISLMASMLLIFLSALVVSISLTIILFAIMGRSVYSRVLANAMCPQARMLADATAKLFSGKIEDEDFRYTIHSSETTVIVLDEKGLPYAFSEPHRDELIPREGEMRPPNGEFGPIGDGRQNESPIADKAGKYFEYCQSRFSEAVNAARYSEFIEFSSELGAVVALPVTDGEGGAIGALFMIKPLHDINETAHSVQIVLIISSVIVALLMVIPIYLVSRWLTDPMRKLNAAAGEFSKGDYSGRVEPEGSREIARLGETFNGLADNLQSTIGDLVVERNRLRAMLDGLGEGIIAYDTDGRVMQSNSSAVRLLNGDPDSDITDLPEYGNVERIVRESIEADCGRVGKFNCGERVIRVSAASIEEENGNVAGAVALLMDMTEAERLEQTRRDYVANVSHELRTPLASIRGIADMLNDGLVSEEADKQRYYGYILKESIRLSTLINDLLELSRLQSGGVALRMIRMELYELFADVCDRASEHAAAHGMSVKLLVPEGRYYARSNPDRMEQVLVSLLDNAVKHGTEGGEITVGMEESGDKWLIFVENPAEIDGRELAHVFERFYKADTAHTGEGTGLGLAITEEVLRLMGESIRVRYDGGLIRFTFSAAKYEV